MEMNVTIFPVRLEWDEVNDKYMQQHYGFIPVTEIAKALDRTEEAIRMYAYKRLKIRSTRPHRQHQDVNKIKQWIYDGLHPTHIAEKLGTSTKSIYNRVRDGLQYDDLDYSALKANARRHNKRIKPIR